MLYFSKINCFHFTIDKPYSYVVHFSSSPSKRNSNMANTFNNDEIIPIFVLIIFSVCSIMVIKWNHLIVYFIDVGQNSSRSWQLNLFISEGLYRLAWIFLLYSATSRFSFHSWSNAGWLIYFNRVSTYALKMFIIFYFLSLKSPVRKEQNIFC